MKLLLLAARISLLAVLSLASWPPGAASAQPAASKGEAELLVPPGGGAFEIPVHAGAVCILSFPEKMAASALTSSADFEVKSWGDDGVAVRGTSKATTATLALATTTGAVKVNVTFRVVPAAERALTLVRFKAASLQEAYEARVAAEVGRRLQPLQAELARASADLDSKIRSRADAMIAERLLLRHRAAELSAHERNGAHVIAHVDSALLLGDDGYLFFEIENRSGSSYRLASVAVELDGKDLAGTARLSRAATEQDSAVLGVVPAGGRTRGIVVVRAAAAAVGRRMTLVLQEPEGRRVLKVTRGVSFQ